MFYAIYIIHNNAATYIRTYNDLDSAEAYIEALQPHLKDDEYLTLHDALTDSWTPYK